MNTKRLYLPQFSGTFGKVGMPTCLIKLKLILFSLFHKQGQHVEFWRANGWPYPYNVRDQATEVGYEKTRWSHPPELVIKINVDVAYNQKNQEAAVAQSIFEDECIAMLDAVKFAEENDLSDTIFESDNKHAFLIKA